MELDLAIIPLRPTILHLINLCKMSSRGRHYECSTAGDVMVARYADDQCLFMRRSSICKIYACCGGRYPVVPWCSFWNGQPTIETNSSRTGIYAASSNLPSR